MDPHSRPRIAAIIPAYNEVQTVGDVVRTIVASPLVDEVIVVSDGSTDGTADAARAAGATIVHELPFCRGKGAAMAYGVSRTKAPVLVFFDADLCGLCSKHIEQLLLPVLSGARAMNVGLRDRGSVWTPLTRHLPLISGERALRRNVFERLAPEHIQGFMVESAMNEGCRAHREQYGSVTLPGLTIRRKYEKIGLRKALGGYVRMFGQVGLAIVIVRVARLLGRT